MRITKNATQVGLGIKVQPQQRWSLPQSEGVTHFSCAAQSSGISLQLAAAAADGLPQSYTLREQTENITPTVVLRGPPRAASVSVACTPLLPELAAHAGARSARGVTNRGLALARRRGTREEEVRPGHERSPGAASTALCDVHKCRCTGTASRRWCKRTRTGPGAGLAQAPGPPACCKQLCSSVPYRLAGRAASPGRPGPGVPAPEPGAQRQGGRQDADHAGHRRPPRRAHAAPAAGRPAHRVQQQGARALRAASHRQVCRPTAMSRHPKRASASWCDAAPRLKTASAHEPGEADGGSGDSHQQAVTGCTR